VSSVHWPVLLLAARREARWLARNPLVLAGFAISCWLIWLNNRIQVQPYFPQQPLFWWYSDVSIPSCLLAAAGGVLLAAQLAAGRARRDGMELLYASYPATAATRAGAQLTSVVGPVLLGLVVTGAAVAWVDTQGALGAPRFWVLGAGLLLIVLAGTAGVALGSWVRHPMAGILAVLVLGLIEIDLVLSWANPVHLPGGTAWLFPWSDPGSVLAMLPGVTVPYPPPVHLAELTGLIVLAVTAALWPVLPRRRALIGIAVVALGLTCWSGWQQAKPVSAQTLGALVRQATQPAQVQTCKRAGAVRYCYYPLFAPLVSRWAVAVNGVLSRVPPASADGLVVRQVNDEFALIAPLVSPTSLTSILTVQSSLSAKLSTWQEELWTDPRLMPGASVPPVYTDLTWGMAVPPGAPGGSIGAAQLALAVSTAEWVTGLPTTGRQVSYSDARGGGIDLLSCVPVGQARAAIALWLAAGVTPAARAAFGASLAGPAQSTDVGGKRIASYSESGSGPGVGLTVTAQGAALAEEMLRLPARQVEAALQPRWRSWLQPQATLAQLAHALRLRLPAQPAVEAQPGSNASYTPPSWVCG